MTEFISYRPEDEKNEILRKLNRSAQKKKKKASMVIVSANAECSKANEEIASPSSLESRIERIDLQDESPTDFEVPKKQRKEQTFLDDLPDGGTDGIIKTVHEKKTKKKRKRAANDGDLAKIDLEITETTALNETGGALNETEADKPNTSGFHDTFDNVVPLRQPRMSTPPPVLGISSGAISDSQKFTPVPQWVSGGQLVSRNIFENSMTLDHFQHILHARVFARLRDERIESLFPVQTLVIPELIADASVADFARPRDVCVATPTGSGKTLCYVVPIINHVISRCKRSVRAVVVAPVQALAQQIFAVFQRYTQGTDLRVFLMSGGQDLKLDGLLCDKDPLTGQRESAYDIIVATPGRLLDYIHLLRHEFPTVLWLQNLRWLVLDEADQMMQEHLKIDWLSELTEEYNRCALNVGPGVHCGHAIAGLIAAPAIFQKVLLSATLYRDLIKLQQLHMFMPKLFVSGSEGLEEEDLHVATKETQVQRQLQLPSELKEYYVTCKLSDKPLMCYHLLQKFGWKKMLCFCNTRENAFRLSKLLSFLGLEGVKNVTGNLQRDQRERIQKSFAQNQIRVLISSDVLSRGMDLEDVDCVLSYDHPKQIQTYIHRVGRTARAGKPGLALTLLTPKDVHLFRNILAPVDHWNKLEKIELEDNCLEKLQDSYRKALARLRELIK